jgi:hypothetical protein
VPDGVIDRIAGNRRDEEHDREHMHIDAACRGDGAGQEKQRIAGQQRKNDQAGLGENHQEQRDEQHPRMLCRELGERRV